MGHEWFTEKLTTLNVYWTKFTTSQIQIAGKEEDVKIAKDKIEKDDTVSYPTFLICFNCNF